MSDFLPVDSLGNYLLALLLVVLLLALLAVYQRRYRQARRLTKVLGAIAFDRIDGLIIPSADIGEIQIDHLLLTSEGLLIVDIKDVSGSVFGSDKMQDWTVISDDHRFTFANPQHGLYDRIAAVRQIVRQVPVIGRVLFLDGAEFTKGVPGLVCTLDSLLKEFAEKDRPVAKVKVKAFKPHWDLIRERAETAQSGWRSRKKRR
ncbi:MAG: NERD domain-containing protein [Gammaproteobacteria bacterium]|nr:NERD domain-containing protein [Pseudomonadota bacterium]TDJ14098.1 MAG: NERD domain-containing protein [Gammaproteobacteria bacterium]